MSTPQSKMLRLAASFPTQSTSRAAALDVLAGNIPKWVEDLAKAAKLYSPLKEAKFDGKTLWLVYPDGAFTEGLDAESLKDKLREVAKRHRLGVEYPWSALITVVDTGFDVKVEVSNKGIGQDVSIW